MDTAVAVVKAYLELCGYFVLAELPVRSADEHAPTDVTDLDIVAVRFPHRPVSLADPLARSLDLLLGTDAMNDGIDGVDVVIGEVKEGRAQLNPALRRVETVAFALRRVGCCPEERVVEEAQAIVRSGAREMLLPGGLRCRVRLVAFAGHGGAAHPGVLTVSLSHCFRFIAERLHQARQALGNVQFTDPVLGIAALQDKVGDAPVARADRAAP